MNIRNYGIKILIPIALFSLLFLFIFMRAYSATPDIAGTADGTLAVASSTQDDMRAFLNSEKQESSVIYPNQTNAFFIQLSSSLASTSVLVDMELHDQNDKTIFHQSWDNVAIRGDNGQTPTSDVLGLQSPQNLPPGVYTWKVGVFTPQWKELIHWYDNPMTFTVASPITTTLGTSTTMLAGTWQLASTTHGSTNYFTADFQSPNKTETVLIEFNVFNSKNQLVATRSWDYVTINPLTTISEAMTTPSLTPDTYHVSIAVYSPQHKELYSWYENRLTFTIAP